MPDLFSTMMNFIKLSYHTTPFVSALSQKPDMPRIPKAKKFDQILRNPKGALHKVYSQSRDLLAIQSLVRKYAPANVHVASIRNKTLHLITSSAATATQLKYRRRNIIMATRKHGLRFEIDNIKVSVRPEDPEFKLPTRQPIPPSAENARQLAAAAQYIEDEALRKALMKLSNRWK